MTRAARALVERSLNHGTSGNVSVREGSGMLITPSGIPVEALGPDQIVHVSLDGEPGTEQPKPSSEWRLHAAVYRGRSDIQALVHTHSPHATALACLRQRIPAFHYMVAAAGGDCIPCAEYATFGTSELADALVKALGRHGRACLMANHGVLAAGSDLPSALALAQEVEYLARVYLLARQAGSPEILDAEEMRRVAERFAGYGQ